MTDTDRAVIPSPVTVRISEPPPFFWQSVQCPTCGAKVGEYCTYPSGRVAHTRHAGRDAAVKAEAQLDVVRGAIERMQTAATARFAEAAQTAIDRAVEDIRVGRSALGLDAGQADHE